jgi:excisionase family DNA binding protein
MPDTYSTEEAAKRVGVHRLTLQRWLSEGKVRASQSVPLKGRTLWRWTDADLKKVRRFKATQKPGRKPKSKQ